MLKFKMFNNNPKNKKTSDCYARALANVLGVTWEDALSLLCVSSMKTGYAPNDRKTIEKVLEERGFVKMPQPRKASGLKYKIRELDLILSSTTRENGVLVNCANHYTVVRDSFIEDTWDCGYKTAGNYFVKKYGKE